MASIIPIESYKNERYRRGNSVSLLFNPKLSFKGIVGAIDTAPSDFSYVPFDSIAIDETYNGKAITCGAFGGWLIIGSVFGEEFGESFKLGQGRVIVSKDTMFFGKDKWLDSDSQVFNVYDGIEYNRFDNVFVSSSVIKNESADYGMYGVGYEKNSTYFIDVNIQTNDFDKIRQLVMSRSIAVLPCDNSLPTGNAYPSDYKLYRPLGGGSDNPLIREAYFVSAKMTRKKNKNIHTLRLMLLG